MNCKNCEGKLEQLVARLEEKDKLLVMQADWLKEVATTLKDIGYPDALFDVNKFLSHSKETVSAWEKKRDGEIWDKAIAICEAREKMLVDAINWGVKYGASYSDVKSCRESAAEMFTLKGEMIKAKAEESNGN